VQTLQRRAELQTVALEDIARWTSFPSLNGCEFVLNRRLACPNASLRTNLRQS
jgi:hypothetical protein